MRKIFWNPYRLFVCTIIICLLVVLLGMRAPAEAAMAGSYSMKQDFQYWGGYQKGPGQGQGQNVIRIFTYLWPRGSWGDGFVTYPTYYQPWVDQNPGSRYNDDYQANFDFSQPNPEFYDHVNNILNDARSNGVTVILILMQGQDYGYGDMWTYNPARQGNNIQSISADCYDSGTASDCAQALVVNPPDNVKNVYLYGYFDNDKQAWIPGYVQLMINLVQGNLYLDDGPHGDGPYDNVVFEVMNEPTPPMGAWQEEIISYIHAHSNIPVLRSNINSPEDTQADAISISYWGILKDDCSDLSYNPVVVDVTNSVKPVYFDTDHNCAMSFLSPSDIDALYCKGYNILELVQDQNDPESEAELARIGLCATDASQCPSCP